MTGYYGSLVGADTLANTQVGGPDGTPGRQVSIRFLALHSGVLEAVRVFLETDPGYGDGNLGDVRFQVFATGSDGLPTGSALGTGTDTNPWPQGKFPLLTFSSAPTLVSGTRYHLVFDNVDAAPATNYYSSNALLIDDGTAQPLYSTWGYFFKDTGDPTWTQRTGYTGILDCHYADGYRHGIGAMEVWVGNPKVIVGTSGVRQLFTVSGATQEVTSVSIRLRRVAGTGALTIRLETGAGVLIEDQTVPAASVPTTYQWVTVTFSATRTLSLGSAYHLTLISPAGTTYDAYPVRDGSIDYDFSPETVFADGYAQFNPAGAGWVGWDQWAESNRLDGDLQFYFTIADATPEATCYRRGYRVNYATQ